ncbi:GntR family transcriptional regulator [Seohaeicola zhoushanensis]|nr:GntR family transcriptional regulator [Seohaeicola zhoushanensis]
MEIPQLFTGAAGADGEVRYRRPQTLPEQIAEQVSYAILRGDYGPGDPVREQDLANLFQVSRGPIREALRILEKDGVVRILPNRGAKVTQLSTKEINDIFEIRAVLSRLAMRDLCQSDDDRIRQAVIDRARALGEYGDKTVTLDEYLPLSYALNYTISSSSGNSRLSEMLTSLSRQTIRYTILGLRRAERRTASARTWRKVADAVEARDAEAAGGLVEKLIIDSKNAAVAEIEASKDAGT